MSLQKVLAAEWLLTEGQSQLEELAVAIEHFLIHREECRRPSSQNSRTEFRATVHLS